MADAVGECCHVHWEHTPFERFRLSTDIEACLHQEYVADVAAAVVVVAAVACCSHDEVFAASEDPLAYIRQHSHRSLEDNDCFWSRYLDSVDSFQRSSCLGPFDRNHGDNRN